MYKHYNDLKIIFSKSKANLMSLNNTQKLPPIIVLFL